MEERKDHLWKVAQEAEERLDDLAKGSAGPVGLDVGTSKIVSATPKGRDTGILEQLNAFLVVPYLSSTKAILEQRGILYYQEGDELVVYGNETEDFANMLDSDARRPMSDGLLNPREQYALPVLQTIIGKVVRRARSAGDVLAFSVPAAPAGRESRLTYHEATLRRFAEELGYRAVAVNEGLAVIFSELESDNFTGIGISCGGGMCNVALAYLSIPSILFSIPKGGDYIDASVGAVVNKHATRVRVLKEEGVDLSRPPKDKFERAIQIYYEDLIEDLVGALRKALSGADKLPKSDRPLPIVLSGGTAKPKGFRDAFEKVLRAKPLPIEVSEVRLARDPLTATARGALIAARYEK
jgi:hypothetical protein